MNPQNQKPLSLTPSQRNLFDKHAYLIPWVTRRLRHHWHPNDHDELLQAARCGLVKACQVAAKKSITDFPPFAFHVMKCACLNRKNRNHDRGNGHVSQQNAKFKERSLSDVLNVGEDGAYTRLNAVEDERGRREYQSSHGAERLGARLFEVREALQNLDTLTSFERRVLKLRFVDGLTRPDIARRLDASVIAIGRAIHSAVIKMRVHFHGWGALPAEAPLPASGSVSR